MFGVDWSTKGPSAIYFSLEPYEVIVGIEFVRLAIRKSVLCTIHSIDKAINEIVSCYANDILFLRTNI